LGQLVLLARLDHREFPAQSAQPVLRVPSEIVESRDRQDNPDRKVMQDRQAVKDRRDLQVVRDLRDLVDQLDLGAPPVLQDF